MQHVIDYYYAPISGYAYLGEQRLKAIAEQYGCVLNFKPVDIGKVFSDSETLPPFKQSRQRINYRLIDLQRTADSLGLPINPRPKYWPVPVDLSARTIYSAINLGVDAHTISFAILFAVYAQQRDVSDKAVIRDICKTLAVDYEKIMEEAQSDRVTQQYVQATQDAIELGVFGSPTYVLNGKSLFFGQDRLQMLEDSIQ